MDQTLLDYRRRKWDIRAGRSCRRSIMPKGQWVLVEAVLGPHTVEPFSSQCEKWAHFCEDDRAEQSQATLYVPSQFSTDYGKPLRSLSSLPSPRSSRSPCPPCYHRSSITQIVPSGRSPSASQPIYEDIRDTFTPSSMTIPPLFSL